MSLEPLASTVINHKRSPAPTHAPEPTGCCECTRAKVAKVFAAILVASAVALAVTILIHSYPGGSTAMYSIFGVLGMASLIALAVAYCKSGETEATDKATVFWTTAEKAMKIAAAILVISAVAITFTALMDTYPNASTAVFTSCGVTATISFLVVFILGFKECQGDGDDNGLHTDDTPPNGSSNGNGPPVTPGGPNGKNIVTPSNVGVPPPQQPSASNPFGGGGVLLRAQTTPLPAHNGGSSRSPYNI